MKSTKKIFAVILSLLMIMTMIPITVLAVNNIAYVDADGSKKTVASATTVTADTTTWSNGWYYVGSDVTISSRISVNGDVKLILGGGYTLTASQGIHVANGDKFTVYTQETAGSLIANGTSYDAAIGGNGKEGVSGGAVDTSIGTIIINGGNITASGGQYSAGIGGGWSGSDGNITINGGNITASGDVSGAGIGASQNSTGTLNINISGGIINATGGIAASAIGSGYGSDNTAATINISGGIITARTNHISAADIGNGVHSNTPTSISITGGTIDVERIGNFDGGTGAVITEISGAIFINNPSAFILKGQYVVTDDGGKYHVYWGGAYISGVSSVNSISVVINGKTYAVFADEYRIVNGNLHLFVPQGDLFVTVNGVDYYGVYSGNISELRKYYKVTDLSVMPVSIKANTAYELATTVTPESALNQTVSYEVTDAGNTGAFLNGNILTAPYGGELILKATAKDNYKSYSKTFTVKVTQTAVTGISGDSSIPTTTDPVHIALPMGVLPEDASHKKVEWSVVEGMAVITGETLKFTSSGKVIIRATVKNGIAYEKDFTKDYTINVNTLGLIDVSQGNVIFSKQDENTVKVIYGNGEQTTFPASQLIKVTGATEQYAITVESGSPNIVLDDCSITVDDYSAIDIMPDASVKLTLSGTNNLEGKCGIHVPSGASLSIDGTGTLTATAADRGAGIGGGDKDSGGAITINGGTVTATGGMWGAGIGGGNAGEGGSITITGGIITATGGYTAAGIGGGNDGSGGTITINGGTVTATSGDYGAGIGGGSNKTGGNITINNGTVTATSAGIGAGIGGGARGGNGGNITINGGEVVAKTENAGAGIGGGTESDGGIIVINGGNITATGSSRSTNGSAGIGGGNNGSGGNITINSGTVTATGGEYGAGIGGGRRKSGGTILINGGIINSNAGYGSAGIGGGYEGSGGNITISGGTVVANGMTNRWNEGTTGIGGGMKGDGGTVVITGGNIKAVPGNNAEAIGKSYDSPTSGTLKDADGNDLKLNTIALDSVAEDAIIEQVKGVTYGINDIKFLDTNKLYFYLPADTEVASVTADSTEYICNRNGTYYAHHGENGYINITDDTHDMICSECEKLFYAGVAHAYNDQKKCVCGHIDHTHSWSYTASGNVITATCSNADGYCTDTNGGTLTISAPAELYTDGTISREAVIDNQLVEATDYTVSYSTADGSAPKTEGTYTASVTVGGATASVEFTLLNYVAKVTDEDGNLISNYKTLADAVTAAQENEYNTLTLLDDITVTTFQIINSGNFTIDLNGKTLLSESSFVLIIQSGAHVIIKDSGEGGTVESKADGAEAIINYGGLTVESGTMKGDGGIDNRGFLNFIGGTAEGVTYSAIDNCASASVYGGVMKSENGNGITNDSGGVLNVYGGKISGCSGIANYDTAFLSGGEFKGNSYAAINLISGTVEITGGSFTGTDDEYGSLSGTPYGESTVVYTEGANLTLKGGEFPNGFTVHDTTANTLLAEGYAFYNKDGNKITVADDAKKIDGYIQVKDHYVVKVTDKDGNEIEGSPYKTFAEAVTAASASEDSTLTLLDDITVDETVEITSGKFTLDVNGKTLLLNNSANIYVGVEGGDVDAANVTFTDTAGGGKITGFRLIYNYATAEITGNISLITDNYSVYNYGEMIISGNAYIYGRCAVNNENLLTVNGGTVESENEGIYNGKELIINNGNLNGSYGIWNVHSGTAEIYGGNIKGREFAVVCDGKTEIYGGTFVSEATETFVVNKQSYENSDLTVYGAEFPNGIYVIETTLNDLLADGYYFRDADGKIITVAENSTGIDGYVKVTKGADFSADAVVTVEDVVYNGTAQEPDVTVTIGGKTLTEGKDYTLTFANNINAGTATVTVKAVGQAAGGIVGGGNSNAGNSVESVYTGEITKEFTILKADSSIDVYPEANKLTYNGEAQTLVVIGDSNDGSIVYSLDGEKYSPLAPTGTNAGEYTVYYKVIGDANHNDSEPETVTVIIGKKPVTASATVPDRIYGDDYQVDTSKVVVTFDGIVDGDDVGYAVIDAYYHMHTVTDSAPVQVVYNVNGADAGNYQFPEYGDWMAPNYGVQATGKVLPRDIADAQITLGDALTYNGAEQTQSIASVTVAGLEVTYTVSNNKAANVGVYELTITANTNFTGTKTVLYAINPDLSGIEGLDQFNVKSNNKADIEYVYNQLDNAETDLASAEKKAEWNEIKDECWQWLKILESVAYRVESLGSCYEKYDIDTVTSADDEALEALEAEMYLFMRDYRDNMTEEELLKVDNARIEISYLRDRIAETKSEYDRVIAAANGYDEATVTSADKDALVQLNEDIYALALTENVTAEEKENLQAAHDKVFALIDKLVGISDEIKRITEKVDAYVFESVKSSDKADIQQLIADIKALLDTQNLTADERALLETEDETCDKLIAKIDETVAEIKRINNATNAYDEATVTSADKEAVEQLIADIKALTDGDNITDAEREQLVADDETLDALLAKINATAEKIARIEEAVNGYDEETVKSTDKANLEQLKEDIKALTDATNITEDERVKLGELDAKLDSLIKKIDDTASEITRIDEAVNSYDKETVTSADVLALGKLIDDIKALTDGQNITDDEKAVLVANDEAIDELIEKLTEVAEEIKKVDEAVKSYDEATVKSSDSDELEQLKEDIQALIDSENTTENEKTALGEMIKDIEGLEDKVEETAKEIERIENAVNGYDEETIKSSDKQAVEQLKEDIQKLVDSGNVTEEEIAGLEETKAGADGLTDKIDETQAEIDRINDAVAGYDEESIKSSDKEAVEQLKDDIQKLIDSGNVTEEEIAGLEETKADADALTDKITETEENLEEIKGIENNFNPENVSSDDKAAIEEKIAEIENVNPDNLTEEQKAEYDEIKAGFEALLDKIEESSKAVTDIGVELEMFDEERVTIFWEDEIEALKAKIDELLADENMGEAEKAKLNEYKAQCDNLIEIINNPSDYFSMRLFHFVWDALHWLSSHVVFIFNWIVAMF